MLLSWLHKITKILHGNPKPQIRQVHLQKLKQTRSFCNRRTEATDGQTVEAYVQDSGQTGYERPHSTR